MNLSLEAADEAQHPRRVRWKVLHGPDGRGSVSLGA